LTKPTNLILVSRYEISPTMFLCRIETIVIYFCNIQYLIYQN
jgi:hypothetical protein